VAKLAHGQYPEQLSQLIPDYLAAVPADPVDGKPLRYRRSEGGTFLLYSVGVNGVDDGGDPAQVDPGATKSLYWLNYKARDWVWPQAVKSLNYGLGSAGGTLRVGTPVRPGLAPTPGLKPHG
jgi:hypothetical protein